MSKIKVLSKFMILCWAAFKATLGCVQPVGYGLDTPWRDSLESPYFVEKFISFFFSNFVKNVKNMFSRYFGYEKYFVKSIL